MNDTALYQKVKLLLDKLDQVFHQEWTDTKRRLGESSGSNYINEQGTFLEPEFDKPVENWSGRDDLLKAYQSAVVALMRVERRATETQKVQPQVNTDKPNAFGKMPANNVSEPVSVFPAQQPVESAISDSKVSVVEKPAASIAASVQSIEETKVVKPASPKEESSSKIDNDELGMIEPRARPEIEKIDDSKPVENTPTADVVVESSKEQKTVMDDIPKPMVGPLGFPSPFSSKVLSKPASESTTPVGELANKASSVAPPQQEQPPISANTGKVLFTAKSNEEDEKVVREKFAYLLEGVEHEKIRDFILADGANTKTDKPSMLIYIPDSIWLEFAFDLDEGRRILNKYPQRDPELIEFMKSTGHSE